MPRFPHLPVKKSVKSFKTDLKTSIYLLNIEVVGSLYYVIIVNVLLAMVALTLGLLLSTIAKSEFQIMQFIPIVVIPQMFFSGIVSVESMGKIAVYISKILPVTYASDGLSKIILEGKIKTLQDAFLPNTPDYLKMNYSQTQEEWAEANEANIWNYFVENDLLFSADPNLSERFITPGPFSKFYTEVDRESSPQIAIWTGWQICKHYLKAHPEEKLQVFLKKNATEIFNASDYRPK